jgi:dynein heavy chain
VAPNNFKQIRPFLADPNFNPTNIRTKSSAAAGLCDWIINITAYYDVVISVEPKKAAVRAAQEKLAEANAKKEEMDTLVAKLTEELGVLQADFQKAMDEKNAAEAEANRCARKLDLA